MKSKIFKKIALCFASALIVCSVGAVAGCNPETDHPEVRITYEFNGETYAVDYKLYRNMYPHTVRHFIELADANFYDNTIIHNYQTNDWFTGGYTYDKSAYVSKIDNTGLMSEYFEDFSKEDAYSQLFADGKLSASVYSNRMYGEDGKEYVVSEDALPTVMGEFYNNINQEIEKGALTADYGCLKMYYYAKESTQKIYVTPTDDQIILADYDSNCATSVFALQTGVSSAYSEMNYTVFAQLKDTEAFDDLVAAVKEYIENNHSNTASDFYTIVSDVPVDNNDVYSNKPDNDRGILVDFNVPKQPIVIQSVKVTKY
ncbi:MAG: peptidylprolyl isomerase [Clostridia bacterium]|nr:peptidylprolyl isomerase [Clostridia bacterium]